jgi:predicted nucleotidyltransferase
VKERTPETNAHPAFGAFADVMHVLSGAGIPFAIGGSFAFHYYTKFPATTKDLDLFLFEWDVPLAVQRLIAAGFDSKVMQEHWLAKALRDGFTVDLIYGSSNFWASVDEKWLSRARPVRMLGHRAQVIPLEELIWSKSYVMARERFDGADVAHLLLLQGRNIDWRRLVRLFDVHSELLLAHLLLFRFLYPAARDLIPARVLESLIRRALGSSDGDGLPFRGPLVDPFSFLFDIRAGIFADPRETLAARRGFPPALAAALRERDAHLLLTGQAPGRGSIPIAGSITTDPSLDVPSPCEGRSP